MGVACGKVGAALAEIAEALGCTGKPCGVVPLLADWVHALHALPDDTASVTATNDVLAYSLASITLRPLLKEEPEITYRLLLNACERLRAMQSTLG